MEICQYLCLHLSPRVLASTALQIALFLASLAVVALVVALIPLFIQIRKNMERATQQLEDLKTDVQLLVQDTRTLVRNVNELSTRAHQQMDEVQKVVSVVRGWSERANRIVEQVGAAVEPPLLTIARNINFFRTGLSVFLNAILHRNNQPEPKDEASHVRE